MSLMEMEMENGNGNIVEKIRKLLRLARGRGATEHEAATAMAMAQKLMLQHNIDNIEEITETIAIRGEWNGYELDTKWRKVLVQAVAKLYNCRTLTRGDDAIQFIGKPSNVLVAMDTLAWIDEQVVALYRQGRKAFRNSPRFADQKMSKQEGRDFRLSFCEACALRIWHRVGEIIAKARNEIPEHMALVVIDQALAAADEILAGLGVGKGRKLMLRRDGFGTGAGRAAGDQIKLQHSVKGETR